ncbi:MAG TPA: sigma-70 family RNA polymerase sigma factor [Polyangiaceae bacterium]|nr:sigma-70 family RNA polymerase sigma factor [Polyangiaceae bacterium]
MSRAPRSTRADSSDEVTLVISQPSGSVRPSHPSGVIAKPLSLAIERARRGDPSALGDFFQTHERALSNYFLGPRHWHSAMVPDLVQETVARAIKAFPSFRGATDNDAARWLFGIARNVHLQEVSRHVGIRLRQDVASELAKQAPQTCETPWFVSDILDALDELPLPQLETLRLVFEGRTIQEIAKAMGVPEGTVATRIHRARKQLRVLLGLGVPGDDGHSA